LNVLQGDMGSQRFRNRINYFDRESIEPTLAGKFIEALAGHPNLRNGFDDLCDIYKRTDSIVPYELRQKRAKWIGEVRELLARSCLTALEPDLIILDEFQHFKHLLNDESEDSELARHLFNYSDEHDSARVLLLSATPYKMYTLAQEDSDHHYQDFVQTLKFLFDDPARTANLEKLISDYRQELFRLREGDVSPLRTIKGEMEKSLRRVMVRTERLAVSTDRDGMLIHVQPASLPLKSDDLHAYLGLAKIAEILDQPAPLEYWKSIPYLFNFMDDYQFKMEFKTSFESVELGSALVNTLRASPQLLLSIKDIENYAQLDPGNARLRSLLDDTVGAGVWRALWLPPAIPYYKLEGVFSDPALTRFTKRLVFSAWRAVPKAISIFLSYEAERLMFQAFNKESKNTKTARERRRPLLRFAQSEGRLTGLPVLGLIYPSQVLARFPKLDPLRLGASVSNNDLPTLDTLLVEVEKQISELLSTLFVRPTSAGVEDERWYWAAPILLDAQIFPDVTREWWQLEQESYLAEEWASFDPSVDDNGVQIDTYWGKHVEEAQKLLREYFSGQLQLGRPPADLPRVLAQIALAGLGVVSLRGLLRVTGEPGALSDSKQVTTNAARIAKSALFLFNLPESMALIRSLNQAEPYWRRVLEYSAAGGLQAVIDEYLHVLHESLGLQDLAPAPKTEALAEHICDVLTFRTSTPNVDHIPLDSAVPITSHGMRGRFAMRFGDEKSEGGAEPTRADRVRAAFNSPFWPFVVATTSIGQEGLDFHTYCHAVVHWNLPTNPVDLEQREGRVHRYKGHAVRKNLARSYALPEVISLMKNETETDVWNVLFNSARMNQTGNLKDISPFWIYPLDGGAKIERHVPALPLSRDQLNLESLQRSLTIYRMVFGQNRQEDLLAYLVSRYAAEDLQVLMQELRIDLAPPR
jgi:hypothetical protein